jgi:uncharacterized caspase-like protein
MVFASSAGSEVSLEAPELQHGAFSYAVLEALQGKATPAGENATTVLDFISYVSRRVKRLTKELQHPYIPLLQDFNPDVALVAKAG